MQSVTTARLVYWVCVWLSVASVLAMQAKREEVVKCRGQLAALEVEKMESEYRIRQEVCREFQEQLVEIEDTHR